MFSNIARGKHARTNSSVVIHGGMACGKAVLPSGGKPTRCLLESAGPRQKEAPYVLKTKMSPTGKEIAKVARLTAAKMSPAMPTPGARLYNAIGIAEPNVAMTLQPQIRNHMPAREFSLAPMVLIETSRTAMSLPIPRR